MKKILVCFGAVMAISAVACGKSAAVSVCEKINSCAGTSEDCNKSSSSDAGTSTSTESKCAAQVDAYVSCLDSKGSCENKVYSAGTKCDTEVAAMVKCATGG